MFELNLDRESLRQGDILAGIPFPLLEAEVFHLLSKPTDVSGSEIQVQASKVEHRKDSSWLVCQTFTRIAFGVVLSNCCDIEPRHGKIVSPTFAMARLIPIPKAIQSDPDKLSSLRANKDPRNRLDPGYVNLFHVVADPCLENKEWAVDFNQIVSVPSTAFPAIMSRKVLQLDDSSRVKFKIKLGASLCRLSESERDPGGNWHNIGLRDTRP